MYSSITKNRKTTKANTSDQPIKSSFNWVAITTLITITVPVLYVIGRAYDDGYLKVYGISADLFQRSTQDYLFFALYGIFQTIWTTFLSLKKEWELLLIGAACMGLTAFILHHHKLKLQPKLFKAVGWCRSKLFLLKMIGSALAGALVVGIYFLVFMLVIGFLAVPLAIGQSAGALVAKEEIKKDVGVCAAKDRKDLTACVQVSKNDKVIMIGRVIASSATHVAVAKDGKAIVLAKDGLSFDVIK
jgi:hypothetical protein